MPHTVLKQLYDDHANFRRLLELMDAELADGRDPAVLHAVMNYMVNYADHFHHPLEDIVFARLLAKDSSVTDKVERLEREHEQLGIEGRRLFELLRDGTRLDEAAVLARSYVAHLDEHRAFEERVLFPLADIVLSARDFDIIRERVEWRADPVFGSAVEKGYRMVLERLSRRD